MKLLTVTFLLVIFMVNLTACNSATQTKSNEKTAPAGSSAEAVKYELVTDAIKYPVQLVAAPDHSGRLFVSDLGGKIYILQNGQVVPAPFIDVSSQLEQKDSAPEMKAVFSIAFHPQFATNKKFYVCYNAPADNKSDKCKLLVSEFKVSNEDPNKADLSSRRTVFEVGGSTVGSDDCQIAFGPDGYLYISVGDNGTPLEKREAQHLDSYLGKLLRIDVDKIPYAVPADNPFVHTTNAKPEIWSYGLRRLWRFSFDPQTQLLFGADIGDKTQEEIDLIQKGGNYGWPIKEGDSLAVRTAAVDTSRFIAPLSTYSHKEGICVIGGSVYHGSNIPFFKDKYLFADYKGTLFSLTKNNQQWVRQTVKLSNPPADPLLIISMDSDNNNEPYVLGVLNTQTGFKGVVYKIVHS